jgi:hypothetical protein
MAIDRAIRERLQAFVVEVLAERPAREDEHIDIIENEMCELADALANEFASQLLARYAEQPSTAEACPKCGRALRHVGHRKRTIVTTRGPVPMEETKCYCPACRRHFFPSVDAAGTGSGL